ncbi:DUF3168 domain-containing protein [Rhizobium puerariae]|uniref:DUF3168 domain-containing protein n=1 Tax=Rhizobium puerariae TaxID=1585791 RepID=A0ABV6ANQ6_9HYPH
MSAISIVRAVLTANAPVTTMVASRIYPIELPQTGPLPAIVLHLSREVDGRHLQGQDQYPVADFITDACGESYAVADAVGEAVKTCLRDYRGTIAGHQVDYVLTDDLDFFDRGQSGTIWRRRQGFTMRYRSSSGQ